MRIEECDDTSDRAGIIDVVRIQPAENLAVAGSDSFIDRMTLPPVFFRNPANAASEALEHFDGVVVAATVKDEVLYLDAGLRRNALERALDELCLIVGGGHHADFHARLLCGACD